MCTVGVGTVVATTEYMHRVQCTSHQEGALKLKKTGYRIVSSIVYTAIIMRSRGVVVVEVGVCKERDDYIFNGFFL